MVVLEGANTTIPMLTIGNNQYLQPDNMSPGNSATVRKFFKVNYGFGGFLTYI